MRIAITFDTDTDDFAENMRAAVSAVLLEAKIIVLDAAGNKHNTIPRITRKLRDLNGNTVGAVTITE